MSLVIKVATAGLTYADVRHPRPADGGEPNTAISPSGWPRHASSPSAPITGSRRRSSATGPRKWSPAGRTRRSKRCARAARVTVIAGLGVSALLLGGAARCPTGSACRRGHSLRRRRADPAAGAGRILEFGAARAGLGVDRTDPSATSSGASACRCSWSASLRCGVTLVGLRRRCC